MLWRNCDAGRFDLLGRGDFLGAIEQRDLAHLHQVHANRIVDGDRRTAEGFPQVGLAKLFVFIDVDLVDLGLLVFFFHFVVGVIIEEISGTFLRGELRRTGRRECHWWAKRRAICGCCKPRCDSCGCGGPLSLATRALRRKALMHPQCQS